MLELTYYEAVVLAHFNETQVEQPDPTVLSACEAYMFFINEMMRYEKGPRHDYDTL